MSDSVLIIADIDALEWCNVAVIELHVAFLNAEMDKVVLVVLWGEAGRAVGEVCNSNLLFIALMLCLGSKGIE